MKILYLENAIGWGGAAICLKLMAQYIDRNKYLPVITSSHNDANYATYGQVATWHYIPDRTFDKGKLIEKYRIPAKLAAIFNYAGNVFPYTARLYALAKRERIDLIHLNNEPINNMAGIFAAKLCGIPCIAHVRGSVMWNSPMSRRLYNAVDHVITVADWVRDNVLTLGLREEKVQTINDGRVLDDFIVPFDSDRIREELGIGPGKVAVGMVGLLIPWKGHRVFLAAAERLQREHPECIMLIIGDAPQNLTGYEAELKALVQERRLVNVRFTGRRQDIPNVMRVMDVIVHASVEPDPYPNVVIEGMSAGRAVIASRLGGPIEMIEDSITGLLVEPDNPTALTNAIGSLVRNPELRRSLGAAAKDTAFAKWAIENHMRQIEQVYDMVLNARDSIDA